jgi:glutamate-1-semialdehyde 2,1-aminomutase
MSRTAPAADTATLLERAEIEIRNALPASAAHYEKSIATIPGGTSRARFWWPVPIYMSHGKGAYVTDIDGVRYIDCNVGFGTMMLGHAHPAVEQALRDQLPHGVFFGAATEGEEALARLLCEHVPGAERVLFVNSGTEATLAALRIARAATGRDKVAKFEGGWHGVQEYLIHSYAHIAGDVGRPDSVPEMPGIPQAVTDSVVTLPFNDRRAFDILRERRDELACVAIEPVQGGAGAMPVDADFLHELRAVCDETEILLLIDEVITGFRFHRGSGSGYYGVTGDLITLGKAIGGGLPAGAVCGREDLISVSLPVSPGDTSGRRPVSVTGTFAANPLTTAAGLAQLETLLSEPSTYPRLAALGDRMRDGLTAILEDLQVQAYVTGIGSMWGTHFSSSAPESVRDKLADNHVASCLLAAYLLLEGVLMSAPVHLSFLCTEHTEADVDAVIDAHRAALGRMRREGCI